MSEKPAWQFDVETAAEECRTCLDTWQAQMNRLRELVKQHKTYAPEAFKVSLEEMMPKFRRATLAVIARLHIMVQIKCGEMRFNEDKPEESGDSSKSE